VNKKGNNFLEEYYQYIGLDEAKARAAILKMEYQKDAFLLCCIALTYRDEALFFKNGKARKKIKIEMMNLAKEYIDKAYELSPLCRDVLYKKGTIYRALNDCFTAIDCFIAILESKEDNSITYNCGGADSNYIKMMTNDARFELYRLFYDLERHDISDGFLREYKRNLRKGVNTIYKPLDAYTKKGIIPFSKGLFTVLRK